MAEQSARAHKTQQQQQQQQQQIDKQTKSSIHWFGIQLSKLFVLQDVNRVNLHNS